MRALCGRIWFCIQDILAHTYTPLMRNHEESVHCTSEYSDFGVTDSEVGVERWLGVHRWCCKCVLVISLGGVIGKI